MNRYVYFALLSLTVHAQASEEVAQSPQCPTETTDQAPCKGQQSESSEHSTQTRDVDFEKIKNLTRPK